jgi:hypothetical protein
MIAIFIQLDMLKNMGMIKLKNKMANSVGLDVVSMINKQ